MLPTTGAERALPSSSTTASSSVAAAPPIVWPAENPADPASSVPLVRLPTGHLMPMLAIGTGKAPSAALPGAAAVAAPVRMGKGRRRLKRPPPGAVFALLNASLGLGFRHIDTSEVYPGFGEIGAALRVRPRAELFLTSKVDPTVRHVASGSGGALTCRGPTSKACYDSISSATNATLARLGTPYVDLLLLHRPPRREGRRDGDATDGATMQCNKLREAWRALEDAHLRGAARSIGLSNCCAGMLRCLASHMALRIPPAVVQFMHHVGMGSSPLGYREWVAKRWGTVYMAYSVLGGVEGDFGKITSAPTVRRIAEAHRSSAANIALSWVAQLGMPLVVLSGNADHLKEDLRLFKGPPWGSLSPDEMAELSTLRAPPGRPSHWGDCVDSELHE